jgi:uncharacterized membrane protein
LIYYFNFLNLPFLSKLEAGEKPKVFRALLIPMLEWFRWSAVATVFFGFWYWGQTYVAAAAKIEEKSPLGTIGLFLLVWVVAWHMLFPMIKRTVNAWVLAVATVVVIIAASWVFVRFIPVGGGDNHVICVGIGGGIGWMMGSNVFGIIYKNARKVIDGTLAGTPPENAAKLMRQSFLAARMNLYLSFPAVFFMAAGSHFPLFGK